MFYRLVLVSLMFATAIQFCSCNGGNDGPDTTDSNEFVIPDTCKRKVTTSGYIEDCECWTKKDSPIKIVGDLMISRTGTVLIEDGVEVLFEKNETVTLDNNSENISIQCLGGLRSYGKQDKPVQFKPDSNTPNDDRWGFIAFKGRAQARIFWTEFSYGRSGIIADDTSIVEMLDCKVSKIYDSMQEAVGIGFMAYVVSEGNITRCEFSESEYGIWGAEASRVKFNNCKIFDNLYYNVVTTDITDVEFNDCLLQGSKNSVYVGDDAWPVFNNCVIDGATEYGFGITEQGAPKLNGSTVKNCKIGVVFAKYSAGTMSKCVIKDNTKDGIWASDDSKPNFEECIIETNSESGAWLNRSTQATFSKCVIRNNTKNDNATGIYVSETSKAFVSYSCIAGNDFGINVVGAGYALLYSCDIAKNVVIGLQMTDSCSVRVENSWIRQHQRKGFQANDLARPVIKYSTISNNLDGGGWIEDNVILVLNRNNILNNERTSVYNATTIIQEWTENWWGTTVKEKIDTLLYDRQHVPRNSVLFEPWADGPYPYPPEVCP